MGDPLVHSQVNLLSPATTTITRSRSVVERGFSRSWTTLWTETLCPRGPGESDPSSSSDPVDTVLRPSDPSNLPTGSFWGPLMLVGR